MTMEISVSQKPRFAALLLLITSMAACTAAPVAQQAPQAATRTTAQDTQPAESESAASPTPTPEPKPKVYRGSGSKVIRVKSTDTPGLISTVARGGSSNFTVYSIGADGEDRELLANGIGDHQGTRIFNLDGEKTVAFKVRADGNWRITIKPLTSARVWGKKLIAGLGDDVLVLRPESTGFQTIKSMCVCDGNFTVTGYDGNAEESLLANEIGNSTAEDTLPDGTILIAVRGDGAWTLQRTS